MPEPKKPSDSTLIAIMLALLVVTGFITLKLAALVAPLIQY